MPQQRGDRTPKFPWKFIGKVLLHLESLSLCGRQPLGSHRYGTRGGGGGGACLMWGIWGERNCHIFKDKESIVPNLNFLFLKALYEWEWKSSTFSMFSLMEFLDTPFLYC